MDLCHPCEIQYNYVVRLETLEDDVPLILERLGNPPGALSLLPQHRLLRLVSDKLEHSTRLFQNIATETIMRLMETYGADLEVFGYTWDREEGANCAVVSEDGKCC